MGNSISALGQKDDRFAFHMSLSADEVQDLWKKEERLTTNQRRARYHCGEKYVVGSVLRPWDIQIIPSIYEIIPRLELQVKDEMRAERMAELRKEHLKYCISELRKHLVMMSAPDTEYAMCRSLINQVEDRRILSVLGIAKFNLARASKYLLGEILEDYVMNKFRIALKSRVDALPPVPHIPFPKNNQMSSLVHHDFRSQDQALHVWDKIVEVTNKVFVSTKVTLPFNEAYRLLRNSGWKVDVALTFHLKDERAFRDLKPKIIEQYHQDDRKAFDAEFAHTSLKRTDFNILEAVKVYGVEMNRRWAAVEELKEELKEMGVHPLPPNRALYNHLIYCLWDIGLAKERFDLAALTEAEAKYEADLQKRNQRAAEKAEKSVGAESGDAKSAVKSKKGKGKKSEASLVEIEVLEVDSDEEDGRYQSEDDKKQTLQDDAKSSSDQLLDGEESKERLINFLQEDRRKRDIPLDLNNIPCEANTEINKLVSFFEGDVTTLEVDAIWHVVTESLEFSANSKKIFDAAGGRLLQEFKTLKKLKPGHSQITRGYDLPAKYVIHTILPDNYDAAKLQACYDSTFELVKQYKLKTFALTPITDTVKNYPRYHAIHLGVLTTRRWIDVISNRRSVDRIIFCTQNEEDSFDYRRIIPFYYPGPNMDSEILMHRYADFKRLYVNVDDQAFKDELASLKYCEEELNPVNSRPSVYVEVEENQRKKSCCFF